jgi:hypothetical protein
VGAFCRRASLLLRLIKIAGFRPVVKRPIRVVSGGRPGPAPHGARGGWSRGNS